MAEVIQFNCPVCATMLRLPLAMAARQGPCPSCNREIVAPDPYRGIGGHEAPQPVVLKVPEPFKPFAETPPLVPKQAPVIAPPPAPIEEPEIVLPPENPAPKPVPATQATVAPAPVPGPPLRVILVLSCLVAGLTGIVIGALGVLTAQSFLTNKATPQPAVVAPKIEQPAVIEAPSAVAPLPAPTPIPEPPKVDPPKAEPEKPPEKISAAAEASLQAFLEAPDWAARNAYVLYPDKVRGAMEAYSRAVPDGPTPFKSISVKQSQLDPTTGNTLFIFIVTTEQFPAGIPVAVKETSGGWLIDWLAFVEFRDSLFQKFVEGPAGKGGFFHLVVSVPPAESANTSANENFTAYFLQSPLSDAAQLAYVKKNTPTSARLAEQTAGGRAYAPVIEVEKRTTPNKQDYFEILSVKADDWFPREN